MQNYNYEELNYIYFRSFWCGFKRQPNYVLIVSLSLKLLHLFFRGKQSNGSQKLMHLSGLFCGG